MHIPRETHLKVSPTPLTTKLPACSNSKFAFTTPDIRSSKLIEVIENAMDELHQSEDILPVCTHQFQDIYSHLKP